MRAVRVGLIGLGTVGSGVVEIIRKHGADFTRRAGVQIELVKFADRNEARFAELGLPAEQCVTDAQRSTTRPSTWWWR
jgi:homoserine dehydrogenase